MAIRCCGGRVTSGRSIVTARHGPLTAWLRGGGRGHDLDVEPTWDLRRAVRRRRLRVWNVGGSWRLKRRLELFGRVENLFDRPYEEVFGFPALGRSAMAGVRVAASR